MMKRVFLLLLPLILTGSSKSKLFIVNKLRFYFPFNAYISFYGTLLLAKCRVMEQPQAIGRALCFGGRLSLDTASLGGLQDNIDKLKGISSLFLVGVGSSFNAASYGAKLFKHAGVFTTVSAMDANATEDSDFKQFTKRSPKSGLVALSQSGETKEIIDTVQLAQRNMVPVMSVVNEVGSSVASMTKCGVYTNAGKENSFLSTKSFTSQVVCLALMSMWFRQTKGKEMGLTDTDHTLAESLQRLPITFGMLMRTQNVCKKAAKKLVSKEHCFVLGKGELQVVIYCLDQRPEFCSSDACWLLFCIL